MRVITIIHTVLLAASLVGEAHAGQAAGWTGNNLKGWCDTGEDACIAYVGGLSDGIQVEMEFQQYGIHRLCIPEGVTYSQYVAVIKKYLTDNPEKLHNTAAYLVHDALADAFPCNRGDE